MKLKLRRWLVVAALWPMLLAAQPAIDEADTRAAHAFFDRHWEERLVRYPESATYAGDLRYNDRITDNSPQAEAAWDALVRERLAQARALRTDRLSATDRVSVELQVQRLAREVEEQPFTGWRHMGFGANGGVQTGFSFLVQMAPVETAAQADQLLRRMAAYPRHVDQSIDAMRRGVAVGWIPTRAVLQSVLRHIDGQLPAQVEDGPFYARFRQLGAGVPAPERERLQAEARIAIRTHIAPSLAKYRAFAEELMPRAPVEGAMLLYPDGCWCAIAPPRHSALKRSMRPACASSRASAPRWKPCGAK